LTKKRDTMIPLKKPSEHNEWAKAGVRAAGREGPSGKENRIRR